MSSRRRGSLLHLVALVLLAGCGAATTTDADAGAPDDAGLEEDASPDPALDAAYDDAGLLEDAGLVEDAGADEDAGLPPPPRDGGAHEDAGATCGSRRVGGERGAVNDDPRFVSVLVNNIENLKEADETCRGDWRDLVYFMRQARPQPDLFLVQQVSNRAQLDRLVAFMNEQLRGTYAGIIAEADPREMGSPCGPEKAQQTNAIIYRTERFAPAGDRHTWQAFAMIDGSCRRSGLARTMYVMHRFRDRVADRDVNVVSLHWSTNSGSGPDPACAERNVEDLDAVAHRAAFAADLLIVGGDANEPDRTSSGSFRPWYRRLTGALDYTDPVHEACMAAATPQACLDGHWTIGSERRIDFLFAQTGAGCAATTGREHTISFDEADDAARMVSGSDTALNYSDHRAVQAEVYY